MNESGEGTLYRDDESEWGPVGYDLDLTRDVADSVSVPVIASGGAGEAWHVADALKIAQAALLASILHENPDRLGSLRDELRELGVPVRDAA